jgi:hypothetical protein
MAKRIQTYFMVLELWCNANVGYGFEGVVLNLCGRGSFLILGFKSASFLIEFSVWLSVRPSPPPLTRWEVARPAGDPGQRGCKQMVYKWGCGASCPRAACVPRAAFKAQAHDRPELHAVLLVEAGPALRVAQTDQHMQPRARSPSPAAGGHSRAKPKPPSNAKIRSSATTDLAGLSVRLVSKRHKSPPNLTASRLTWVPPQASPRLWT